MSVKQVFNTSAELDYPKVLPTLDLDFANSKTLDPRITFTRASGGSYYGADGLIKYAGVNEPRFDHDPYTGESLGFLVEEVRTNLITYSEQFDNAYWQGTIFSRISNAALAPDGTVTADKLTPNNGISSNNFTVFRSFTGMSGSTTGSFYVKSAGHRYARISAYTLDLLSIQNGQFSVYVGNGWHRIHHVTEEASFDFGVNITAPLAGQAYTGDGTSGIFIWGAQVEAGSFPTSYIPTEASTRTRAADVASMTASPYLYGTFLARYKQQPPSGLYRQIFSVGNADAYTAFVCRATTTSAVNIVLPGILDLTSTANTETSGFNNVATTRVLGDYAVCLNGGTVAKSSITSDQSNNSVITFMYGTVGATSGGTIARLTYYPKRLTNQQLQTLTT